MTVAVGGDNRADFEDGALAGDGIVSSVYFVQRHPTGVGHLPEVIDAHGLFEINPLKRHPRGVGPQH